MANIKTNDRIFVSGKTGSGKTHFVKKKLWGLYPRRIFHDVKLENADLLANSYLCRTPTELRDSLVVNRTSILYQPRTLAVDDFDSVCEIIYKKGNYTLFVDEASAYCSASNIEQWHREIMVRGRSRGVGIVNLTQRPRRCHSDVISEAEHFFIFHLSLETDVEKIKFILPKQYRETPYKLPDYHFLYVNSGNVVLHKPI